MTELMDAGAIVMPANPAFYGGPQTLQGLVDFFVGRVMDQMGIETGYPGRWEGRLGAGRAGCGSPEAADLDDFFPDGPFVAETL